MLLLNELDELLELAPAGEFEKCLQPLLSVLCRCMASNQFQIAERALFLWNNEQITSNFRAFLDQVMPRVFGVLMENSSHWNMSVQSLTQNVQTVLTEMDADMYEAEATRWNSLRQEQQQLAADAKAKWDAVVALAGVTPTPEVSTQ